MKLIPLIDRKGTVRAWADRQSGWTCDSTGNVFLLIAFDGVFQFTGEQLGWFYGNHIRDRYGRVVLARPNAKIEGLIMPRPEKITKQPQIYLPTGRPVLRWLLPTPPMMKQRAWRSFDSLFSSRLERVRTFEEKLRKLRQKA
jgi:hypothetical protein